VVSRKLALVGLAWLLMSPFAGAESLTLTTTYPAPSGIYKQIVTTDKTILARDDSEAAKSAVGMGTALPKTPYKLHVRDNDEGYSTLVDSQYPNWTILGFHNKNSKWYSSYPYSAYLALLPVSGKFSDQSDVLVMYGGRVELSGQSVSVSASRMGVGMSYGRRPAVQLEVADDTALKLGSAYQSSGGAGRVNMARNEWHNGTQWTTTAPGALIQIEGQEISFYSHDAESPVTHKLLAKITASGDVCNGAGKCVGNATLGQNDCSWHYFSTWNNFICPTGKYVAGVTTNNESSAWGAGGGVYCCQP
jgi:hypothetical protein